jgi:hypothetical protein
MAAGDTAPGTRCADIEDTTVLHDRLPEGGYRRERQGETWIWVCRPPGREAAGSLRNHEITEHDDGTITVSPSILMQSGPDPAPGFEDWHGYLERGVWREV